MCQISKFLPNQFFILKLKIEWKIFIISIFSTAGYGTTTAIIMTETAIVVIVMKILIIISLLFATTTNNIILYLIIVIIIVTTINSHKSNKILSMANLFDPNNFLLLS